MNLASNTSLPTLTLCFNPHSRPFAFACSKLQGEHTGKFSVLATRSLSLHRLSGKQRNRPYQYSQLSILLHWSVQVKILQVHLNHSKLDGFQAISYAITSQSEKVILAQCKVLMYDIIYINCAEKRQQVTIATHLGVFSHGTTLTVRKFGRLAVTISVWTERKCWTVLCERSALSNLNSTGRKFVRYRVHQTRDGAEEKGDKRFLIIP